MKTIGIAGGIGSGKTTITQVFKHLGIPVYCADTEAKKLMQNSDKIRQQLIENFGAQVYNNRTLQKNILANIIFNDENARKIVNNIVHPVVRQDFLAWAKRQNTNFVMIESAIMFDTDFYKFLDVTILVLADEEQRIKRVIKRDSLDMEAIKNRLASQKNPENHKNLATFLIRNNDEDEILPQVLNILNTLKNNG